MGTLLHPTAGYIADVGGNERPGRIERRQVGRLRDLAERVGEIAAKDCQKSKRDLWYKHCRMRGERPMLLVFPEDSWIQIIGQDQLALEDPYWRQWEWYLKMLIYRHQFIADDFVIEPIAWVPRIHGGTGWGVSPQYKRLDAKGSYVWNAPMQDIRKDMKKLRKPEIWPDDDETELRLNAVTDVFGGILEIRPAMSSVTHVNLAGELSMLRGLNGFMEDIYDRPDELHELMDFLADGVEGMFLQMERQNMLELNNYGHYNNSGGIDYSDDLPAPGYDGKARLQDLHGFGVAQEFSEISPVHHKEFLLDYQLRSLRRFGIVSYGCCEPYTRKFDMLLDNVPRLRRVSVSPWCDRREAAEKLKGRAIYSLKPNPAYLAGNFHPEIVLNDLKEAVKTARGNALEIILKDTFTIENDPARVTRWTELARTAISIWGS